MSGRVVLVTGGAAGIGWATARRFGAAGDRVMIADIDGERAAARVAELGSMHHAVRVDLADPTDAVAMIAACIAACGRLDILVNNAGRIDSSGTSIVDQPTEAFNSLIALNLDGTVAAANEAARVMTAQGGGAIVNVASGAALRAIPLRNAYSASKAAVVAATRNLACRLAPHGIQVSAIAPGYTRTELVDTLIRNGRVDPAKAVARIPLGRMGVPDEMADAIFHLASPAARAFVGGLLLVDGGGQAYGGSETAGIPRGAPSTPPPPGAPVVVLRCAHATIGAALRHQLEARATQLFCVDNNADLTDRSVAAGAIRDIVDHTRRIDALVTIATDLGDVDCIRGGGSHTDLMALFHLSQAAGRVMLQQGFGAVCAVTSARGLVGLPAHDRSAETSAAIAMFTKSMACEWGGSGVRANTLAVGPMDHRDALMARMPLRQVITAAEVAANIAFLVSPAASYISGATMALDGGLSMYAGSDL